MCTLFIGLRLRSDIGSVVSSPPPSSSPDTWQLPRVLGLHSSHHPPGKSTTFKLRRPEATLFTSWEYEVYCAHFLSIFCCLYLLTSPWWGAPLKERLSGPLETMECILWLITDCFKKALKEFLQHAKLGHLSKIRTQSICQKHHLDPVLQPRIIHCTWAIKANALKWKLWLRTKIAE